MSEPTSEGSQVPADIFTVPVPEGHRLNMGLRNTPKQFGPNYLFFNEGHADLFNRNARAVVHLDDIYEVAVPATTDRPPGFQRALIIPIDNLVRREPFLQDEAVRETVMDALYQELTQHPLESVRYFSSLSSSQQQAPLIQVTLAKNRELAVGDLIHDQAVKRFLEVCKNANISITNTEFYPHIVKLLEEKEKLRQELGIESPPTSL